MFLQLESAIVTIILLILACQDAKSHHISGTLLWISFFMAMGYLLSGQGGMLGNHVLGLTVGLAFCFVSFMTKEGIGYGDSLLLCVMGLYMGLWNLLELLVISWALLGIWALCLVTIKKCSKKAAIPYVPFLLAAHLLKFLLERGST